MSNEKCSICGREIDPDVASILAIGGYGKPRFVCDLCESEIDKVTKAKEVETVESAMSEISKRLAETDADDTVVIETINSIFEQAGDRAKKIKSGEYDFSLDSEDGAVTCEDAELAVPEELLETEEDRALDEAEATKNRKFDKIFNWIIIALSALALSALIYTLIKTFV